MTPSELRERMEGPSPPAVLDVRTHAEWSQGHLPGSIHVPLDELPARLETLDRESETVVVCAHGVRSAHAVNYLRSAGFSRVRNLRGGLAAW